MTTVESKGILLELRTFLKELIAYGNDTSRIQSLKKDEKEYAIKLRKKLVYKVGSLKGDIILLTGIEQVPIIYRGREYPTDIWLVGLRPKINWRTSAALHYCIDATRQAVGRIKSDIRQGYRDKEGKVIEKPPKTAQDYGGRIIDTELELRVQGTPDMILECIRSTAEKLNSKGHTYSFRRTSGAPDYARWDKTYFASCAISQGDEGQIGTIKLQLLPDDKTLLKTLRPDEWNSSYTIFLNSLFTEFQQLGYLKEEKPAAIGEIPKAFIAHGGQSPALDKLKNFLIALGVEPLVVEEQASEGRSVAENVDWYARQADCAIILATKGDIDGKTGSFIPRGNVLMEIGKLQQIFKDRIIYLLQAGTKFPTNISEKVRERFTTQSMDKAFIKIAKELKKFGILKAVKP